MHPALPAAPSAAAFRCCGSRSARSTSSTAFVRCWRQQLTSRPPATVSGVLHQVMGVECWAGYGVGTSLGPNCGSAQPDSRTAEARPAWRIGMPSLRTFQHDSVQ